MLPSRRGSPCRSRHLERVIGGDDRRGCAAGTHTTDVASSWEGEGGSRVGSDLCQRGGGGVGRGGVPFNLQICRGFGREKGLWVTRRVSGGVGDGVGGNPNPFDGVGCQLRVSGVHVQGGICLFWNFELLGLSVWYNCKVSARGLVFGEGKGGQGAQGGQFAHPRTLLE